MAHEAAHHHHDHAHQPDYGTGQKKLSIYIAGVISCIILTLVAFWAVISGALPRGHTFLVIFGAAIVQFFVQVICFLRLNTSSPQARANVLAFVFTIVILVCVIVGSLWIMWDLGYRMMS